MPGIARRRSRYRESEREGVREGREKERRRKREGEREKEKESLVFLQLMTMPGALSWINSRKKTIIL